MPSFAYQRWNITWLAHGSPHGTAPHSGGTGDEGKSLSERLQDSERKEIMTAVKIAGQYRERGGASASIARRCITAYASTT